MWLDQQINLFCIKHCHWPLYIIHLHLASFSFEYRKYSFTLMACCASVYITYGVRSDLPDSSLKRKPLTVTYNGKAKKVLKNRLKKNGRISSSQFTPWMDWKSGDLPEAWRLLKQHCTCMSGGPLKSKSVEQKCNYSGWRHQVIKCTSMCFIGGIQSLIEITQCSPYYITDLNSHNGQHLPGLFVSYKRHQAMVSPSHVHRSAVN